MKIKPTYKYRRYQKPVAEKYQPVVNWYNDYLGSGTYGNLKQKMINVGGKKQKGYMWAGEEQSKQYLEDYPHRKLHREEGEEDLILGPSIKEEENIGHGVRGQHSHRQGYTEATRSGITINPRSADPEGVMAHELGHTEGGFYTGEPKTQEEINKRNKAYSEDPDSYEADAREVRSDLVRFRWNAEKDGIYKSTGEFKEFTQKDLDKMKQADHEGHGRLFDNFEDKDIIWMMNNIAMKEDTEDGLELPVERV
jgi:succinate dehydrogenase flavin-adding protein (antitoxin of CptAB toxin-antitoxin module)